MEAADRSTGERVAGEEGGRDLRRESEVRGVNAKPEDKILDTHLGSGSSRIAAYDAGLDFTGYEIDTGYFNAKEERFQAHIAQKSLFV